MEFSAREDIEAPIDFVFGQITDFDSFERSVMVRGGDIERMAGNGAAVLGTKWHVKFRLRGKDRAVDAELTEIDPPNGMTIQVRSGNVDGSMVAELVALSSTRTRLIVKMDATAKSLAAKLLFQSVRFARAKTDRKFKKFVAGYAEDCEARYNG